VRAGIAVVEDAAQAHGAKWGTRFAGTLGDLGCFSFQSAKTLATGEGGAVLTDDDELARRVRLAANLGEHSGGEPTYGIERFDAERALEYALAGTNHRMGALQAALGIAQLERLDDVARAMARNRERLREGLADVEGIRWQATPAEATPCATLAFLELEDDALDRDELARALAAERIDCRKTYAKPLAAHALFGGEPGCERRFPVATRVCRRGLGLRIDARLGARAIDATALAVERVVAWMRRGGAR
jgi:perosamine synthetase